MSMKMTFAACATLIVGGCYSGSPEHSQSLAQEPAGTLHVALTAEKLIKISASGARSVEQVLAVTTSQTSPDTRTIELGIKQIDLMVDGMRCSAQGNGVAEAVLMCDGATENAVITSQAVATEDTEAAPAQRDIASTDLMQRITIDPEMHCGMHYDASKWQARFYVSIQGEDAALAQVQTVHYDVFSDYAGNGNIAGSDPATGFAPATGFLTPVSGWSTGPARVTLKSGAVLNVPGAVIRWTNPDPEGKPTGQSCSL